MSDKNLSDLFVDTLKDIYCKEADRCRTTLGEDHYSERQDAGPP